MPIRKKGDIEIEMDDGEGGTEIFRFLPLGLTGIFDMMREEAGDTEMFNISSPDIDPEVQLGDKIADVIGKNADKIFNTCMERCISHKIIDREKLHTELSGDEISEDRKAEIEQEISEADYFVSDFSIEEQAEILRELMGSDSIQEGTALASNFQGDQ